MAQRNQQFQQASQSEYFAKNFIIYIDDPFGFAFDPNFQASMSQVQDAVKNPFFQQIGMNLGTRVLGFTKKYDSIFEKMFSSDYRYYFDVDNRYVMKKLLILHFPYLFSGEWSSITSSSNQLSPSMEGTEFFPNEDIHQSFKHGGFATPKNNIHAPDLYIPVMALITFTLISCFSIGKDGVFHPNLIYDTFWKCIVVTILELFIFKIVFCFLEGNRVGTFDLLSHLNYRYATLVNSLILSIIFDAGSITFIATWYFFICQGFFVYKTLQRYTKSQNRNQFELSVFGQNIIAILSILQPFFSWVLLKIIGVY